jgi:hypothetical protein
MSTALFDLGARLRALDSGVPTPIAHYSPALPINSPVAVTLTESGGTTALIATDGQQIVEGRGPRCLGALDELGVSMSPTHRTLVVADRSTVAALGRLARAHPQATAAPVAAWWDQRADHPGSGAVLIALEAARSRWALGAAPDQERDLTTWFAWLGIEGAGPTALLALARHASEGAVLPGLLDVAGTDTRSWDYHRERIEKGWDWRSHDTRAEAALGLTTRSDAADLFASLRLGDPLVAERAAWAGDIVPGFVRRADKGALVIDALRPVSRLRTGSRVQGWLGGPSQTNTSTHVLRSGVVAESTLRTDGQLSLTITDHTTSPHPFAPGSLVCLRPASVDARQQARGRSLMNTRHRKTGNWLAGRGTPSPLRTDVPLDVILAAAGDE